jgi:uncharacterized membrane protein YqhA
MNTFFFAFRFVSLVAVFSSLLGSILMFVIGATKTYYAFAAYFLKYQPPTCLGNLKGSDIATAYLIKSFDAFLIALVLFIFAYGVYWIFVAQETEDTRSDPLKSVRINTIGQLKKILAEIVIIILFVKFLEIALINLKSLTWELLILPASILLLALALKFMELKEAKSVKD